MSLTPYGDPRLAALLAAVEPTPDKIALPLTAEERAALIEAYGDDSFGLPGYMVPLRRYEATVADAESRLAEVLAAIDAAIAEEVQLEQDREFLRRRIALAVLHRRSEA